MPFHGVIPRPGELLGCLNVGLQTYASLLLSFQPGGLLLINVSIFSMNRNLNKETTTPIDYRSVTPVGA